MTSAMRQAENTRLLVSSDDASTASPTSGWSRVAMGAGIGLGAIAAVAALATRPETFSDITLGYGISLPSDAHAQGLSTEAIRPVAPGQPAGAHDELSTEDAMRLNPSLGKSHAHASSTDDDSDRDQQFLVPSVVVDKIAEKLAKSKTSHRYDGLISKKSKHGAGVLETPVYIIAMEQSTKDARRVAEMLERLMKYHGSAAVKEHVHITPGINIAAWPEKIELAEYALKSVLAVRKVSEIGGLPWLETYANRDKHGKISNPQATQFPLSHHIGCLYAHLHDWQMSFDAQYETTVILESDAIDPSLLGVELSSVQSVVDNAPADFDLIFLTNRQKGGKLAKKFTDPMGNELKLYHLTEQNEEAGLSSYIVSATFYKKLRRYIVEYGADMVDAWLSAKLCVKPAFDKNGKFVAWEENGGGEYRYLSCYHVQQEGFRSVVSDDYPTASR